MNKIPFLTAVALVVGTSAAFAADIDLLKPDFSSMGRCAYEQHIKTAPSYSGNRHCGTDQHATVTSAASSGLLKPIFATAEQCTYLKHIKTAPSYSATRQICHTAVGQ